MFKRKEKKGLDKFVKGCKLLDYFINVILSPRMWVSNKWSSKETNKMLKNLVLMYEDGKCDVVFSYPTLGFKCDDFYIKIWINNYPYAFGNVYTGGMEILPTRYYRLLFKRWLEATHYKKLLKEKK
jgi:hypothetical protein